MGDSLFNFGDVEDNQTYTGLSDTGLGFSGSSTVQDVQLGSPLVLDTSINPESTYSIPDFANLDYGSPGTSDLLISGATATGATASQTLAGTSDTPPAAASQTNSTPTPNVTTPNTNVSAALGALGKFGASLGAIFGGQQTTHGAVAGTAGQPATTPGGAVVLTGGVSGTNTIVLLIVVVALIALVARGE